MQCENRFGERPCFARKNKFFKISNVSCTTLIIRIGHVEGVEAGLVETLGELQAMLEHLAPSEVIELDSDHDVMLSHPRAIADVLNGIASRL